MTLASFTKGIELPQEQLIVLNVVSFGLLLVGIHVYRKMLRRVDTQGGQVRTDRFELADLLMAGAISAVFLLLLFVQWFGPAEPPPATPPGGEAAPPEMKGPEILYGSLFLGLPVAGILAMMIGRGINVPELFGLRRVGLVRAVLLAAGLLLLLLPAFMIVTAIAYQFLGQEAEQQKLVEVYQNAAKTGKHEVVWYVVLGAVIIAPITEEVLFRGYLYPVLKRTFGPFASAFAVSALFAAIHNNALGMPGLTLLALGLTLAYEWSGSILVSIFMHAWFNATTLFAMWWAIQHGYLR